MQCHPKRVPECFHDFFLLDMNACWPKNGRTYGPLETEPFLELETVGSSSDFTFQFDVISPKRILGISDRWLNNSILFVNEKAHGAANSNMTFFAAI